MSQSERLPKPGDTQQTIEQLNSLLRLEMSAAEIYRMAIDRVLESEDPDAVNNCGLLQEMEEDHGRTAQLLRDRLTALGGEPADTAGAWGLWVQGWQAARNLAGERSALAGLKEGEQSGLKEYLEAAEDVDCTTASVIRSQVVPTQERHIDVLEQMIESMET